VLANVETRKRRVKELITFAGVIEPPRKGDGRLATESILVFSGNPWTWNPWNRDLTIFDQEGDEIGAARNSRGEYELSDAEPLCRVRRTYKSWHKLYFEFSVLGLDGTEIGTIGRQKQKMLRKSTAALGPPPAMGWSDADHRRAAPTPNLDLESLAIKLRRPDGSTIATLRDSQADVVMRVRSDWRRFYIEDEPGHEAARLTYSQRPSLWATGYVLELQTGLSEPLRTLIVATVLPIDNNIVDHGSDGGVGGT
jgi:hypothetical protein